MLLGMSWWSHREFSAVTHPSPVSILQAAPKLKHVSSLTQPCALTSQTPTDSYPLSPHTPTPCLDHPHGEKLPDSMSLPGVALPTPKLSLAHSMLPLPVAIHCPQEEVWAPSQKLKAFYDIAAPHFSYLPLPLPTPCLCISFSSYKGRKLFLLDPALACGPSSS